MKKLLFTMLIFVFAFTLVACSGDGKCSHKDKDDDHVCDSCKKELSECEDGNDNHKCDVCNKVLSNCEDDDDNHKCDVCEDTLSECEDEDENGECDVCGTEMKLDITGVTLTDKSFVYDGTEKSLVVSGSLPQTVTVTYTNNKATDAGTYNVTALLRGEGYNDLTLTATLTVTKADITGISAEENQSVACDGEAKLPEISGTLPSGVTAKFYFNNVLDSDGVSEVGVYSVKIVFSGKNYNEKILNVTLTIKEKTSLAGLANTVISSFGSVPDAWSFFPESFKPENRVTTLTSPIDYSSFVDIDDIPYNGMGKQLNMVYGVMNKMDTALGYVNTVYGAMNVVKGLYSTFLDGNPEDYQSFTGNAGPFAFTITLDGSVYNMVASVGPVEVLITSDTENETYGARVQLTATTVLKYEVEENSLKVAVNVLGSASMLLEFTRDEDVVTGTVYEFLTVAGFDLVSTSAMIHIDDTYTTLIGTKGDFLPLSDGRNCEIYRNDTGEYVGAKVREVESTLVYNTYWFPLINVDGINNIKMIEENNGKLNPFTVYINGSSSFVVAKRNLGGFGSRHYDIEFKSMYYFTYNEAEESYESIELLVPMIFIQQDNLADFEEEFYKENKAAVSGGVSLEVVSADFTEIDYAYTTLLPDYDEIKDSITINDVKTYCGITVESEE